MTLTNCASNDDMEVLIECTASSCDDSGTILEVLIAVEGTIKYSEALDTYYITYGQMPTLGIGLVCGLPAQLKEEGIEVIFSGESRWPVTSEVDLQQKIFGSLTPNRRVLCLALGDIDEK